MSQTLKKILAAICIAAMFSGAAPASASSRVDFVQYSNKDLNEVLKHRVKWEKSAVSISKKVIRKRLGQIEATKAQLKKLGILRLKVRWTTRTLESIGAAKLGARKTVRAYKLLGYDYAGTLIKVTDDYPDYESDIPGYLFHPKFSDCRIDGVQILDPSSWFSESCSFSAPTPEQFLAESLKAYVVFSNPNDEVLGLQAKIEALPATADLQVNGGQLVCSQNCGAPGFSQTPSVVNKALGGYSIDVVNGKVKISGHLPDIKALAAKVRMGADGTFVTFS